MPKKLDNATSMDIDLPLIENPTFTSSHIFSTNDVTGTFDGLTQETSVEQRLTPVVDFTADPLVTEEGLNLYPVNSEFGFVLTDFVGAVEKDYALNPEYAEGWVGDIKDEGGEQIGLTVSDAPTDTFKTPALLGTWLAGLGGNTVKASTEHYVVMQNVLSDQRYPGDSEAVYPLDDDLRMIGGEYDGRLVADILPIVGDANEDGTVDIRDVLDPNETTIDSNIAASSDYSVTVKDDGKLLYRWGNLIKKPNDIRLEATLELPDEWTAPDYETSVMGPLFQITDAELLIRHTITNNPNDQVRPEDFENEAAIGTLPEYDVLPDGKWVSVDDYYAGDGTLYPAGTVLRDPALIPLNAGSALNDIGAMSTDLLNGFTNAYYTTMNREPFEPVITDGEYDIGPRWRLQPDKYGQDLPSVVIPQDPSKEPPATEDEQKYEVGLDTQTVLNLLDWEAPVSPLDISAGWTNNSGTVSENGLNMTDDFDIAFYIKGDIKPATVYDTTLVMNYEALVTHAEGATVNGTADADILVGAGGNTMSGGTKGDLFVLSYGTVDPADIVASTITDFEVDVDAIGLVGMGVDDENFRDKITQTVVSGNLVLALDGVTLATLDGVTEPLSIESFRLLSGSSDLEGIIAGDAGDNTLTGDASANFIVGLGGNDTISGLGEDDTLYGGADNDTVTGGDGNDMIYGGTGDDELFGEDGFDWLMPGEGTDTINGGADTDMVSFLGLTSGVTVDLSAGTAVSGGQSNTLVDIENVTGTIFGDVITGDDGANWIRALGDYDWIIGSDGADTLDGGTGQDMVSYVNAALGVEVDLGTGAGVSGQAAGDTYISIERATGSVFNDIFHGTTGEDTFRGLGGYDTFYSSTGGRDRYDGGSGLDTVSYADAAAGISASLIAGFGSTGDALLDLYTSIENLSGSAFDDILTGDSGRNILIGADGNDSLDGGADVDRLTGGAGDDQLDGGWGWDYAHFAFDQSEYTVSTVNGVTTVEHLGLGADGTDTLVNIEVMSFADGMVLV